ncbi:hypothetical protein EYC84_007980 [Monilinia fructicola]|uniref:Uncharacterized protein n=1 Tax=Monilinia fructicola TaxID=38448 RepID=A0A5M9JDS3_MONFR|nr:hypothetical protein EYC84_007980 [Monilinia fructicola]
MLSYKTDHHINGSAQNNILNSSMDLILYCNDTARKGALSLPALRPVANYVIEREVGMSESDYFQELPPESAAIFHVPCGSS